MSAALKINQPRRIGDNSGDPAAGVALAAEMTMAERLEFVPDQLEIDYAHHVRQRDALVAAMHRFALGYSTLPVHPAEALPAEPAPATLIVIEHRDGTRAAAQWDGTTFKTLNLAQFLQRVMPTVMIPDAEEAARATSFVKKIKVHRDGIEKDRVGEKKPYDDAGGAVQAFFKPKMIDVLEAIYKAIEQGPMKAYSDRIIAEEKAQRAAEAKRLADEAKAALAAAVRTGSSDVLETAQQIGELADRAAERAAAPIADMGRTRGSMGGTSTVITTWKYRITDQAKLPAKYLIVDHAALARDVKANKNTTPIPGVEMYADTGVSVR
jgi:hypothetical protein